MVPPFAFTNCFGSIGWLVFWGLKCFEKQKCHEISNFGVFSSMNCVSGLNTTLTGALLRFQVGILQAFESFCKIEDRMTIDPYGRFNSICLVLFDIERYVSSNLATDMKPNNMLSPFLQECPTESQVIQMHYSLSVADKKPSSTMYMSEPPRKIVRTESALIPRHYPVAAGNWSMFNFVYFWQW